MSIFGNSYSKIKTSEGVEISLGHSIIRPTYQEPNIIEQRSIINGVRTFTKISENFASFDVIVNIQAFGASDEAKVWEIMRENHTTVSFMPHQDVGNYLKTFGGAEAEFFITRMIPYYLKTDPPILHDRLLITLKSKVYVDVTADLSQVPTTTITDDLEDTITDDLEDTITDHN